MDWPGARQETERLLNTTFQSSPPRLTAYARELSGDFAATPSLPTGEDSQAAGCLLRDPGA